MRRSILFLVPALLAACAQDAPTAPDELVPAMAASAVTSNLFVPLDIAVFIPCAADGAGETVFLSGTLHLMNHMTVNDAGHFLFVTHAQPQELSGAGSVTGDSYQGVGVTRDTFRGRLGQSYTFVNNFRMIGQGPGNNSQIHHNVHFTINANGEITADVDSFRATCR